MPGIGEHFIPQAYIAERGALLAGPIIPVALLEYPGLSHLAKIAWAALSSFAGVNGICYPSYRAWAKGAGMSLRQIKECAQELREKGFIDWGPKCFVTGRAPKTRSNVYALLWHEVFEAWERGEGKRRKAKTSITQGAKKLAAYHCEHTLDG